MVCYKNRLRVPPNPRLSGLNHFQKDAAYEYIPSMGRYALLVVLFLPISFAGQSTTLERAPKCRGEAAKPTDQNLSTRLRLMEESSETSNARIETVYDAPGHASKQRVIINSQPGPPFDAVGALTLSEDGKHYAYSAVDKDKLFPVVDGKPQEFHLKVDTDCCGEGGHWFEVWQYTEYIFSPDGNRIAFVEISERGWKLILDGKVIDRSPIVGDFRFSPNGSFLAYFTTDSTSADNKGVFLSINGKRLWTFDPAHSPYGDENVKIQSLNNDSVEAVGYDSGKPVRVTCKLEDRGQ